MYMLCDENMDGIVSPCELYNCGVFGTEFLCGMKYEKSGYDCLMMCDAEENALWCRGLDCEDLEWMTAANIMYYNNHQSEWEETDESWMYEMCADFDKNGDGVLDYCEMNACFSHGVNKNVKVLIVLKCLV